MDMNFRRYPIGIQNFELLRNDNYVYVDKTPLVYKLANTKYNLFSEPPPTFWENSQTFLIVLRKVSHHDEKIYSSL